MRDARLFSLLWGLIGAADSGAYQHVSVADAKRAVRARSVPELLRSGDHFVDVSLLEPADWDHLHETWGGFADVIDEDRKMGVVNNGICLLIAYVTEQMQQQRLRAER